jgi:hypothetical protein
MYRLLLIIINCYQVIAKTLDKIDNLIIIINQLTIWWINQLHKY